MKRAHPLHSLPDWPIPRRPGATRTSPTHSLVGARGWDQGGGGRPRCYPVQQCLECGRHALSLGHTVHGQATHHSKQGAHCERRPVLHSRGAALFSALMHM